MSPQSWHPSSSLSNNCKNFNLNENSETHSINIQVGPENKQECISNQTKSSKNQKPQPVKLVSQSIDFIDNKSNKLNQTKIDYKRNKSFIAPSNQLKVPFKSYAFICCFFLNFIFKTIFLNYRNRPVSVTGSFIFGNKNNIGKYKI